MCPRGSSALKRQRAPSPSRFLPREGPSTSAASPCSRHPHQQFSALRGDLDAAPVLCLALSMRASLRLAGLLVPTPRSALDSLLPSPFSAHSLPRGLCPGEPVLCSRGCSVAAAGPRDPADPRGISPSTADMAQPRSPAADADSRNASGVVEFLTLAGRLKRVKRQGWVNHGVSAPESVADHMHRMTLMALVTADIPGVDRDKCVKMAAVHDVAEAIVGDITPSDGVSKEEKSRRETAAMDEMCSTLGNLGTEMRQLWQEYEDAETEEAKLVKDFDKIEMILQALEYENEQGMDLEEFFTSTRGKFKTKAGQLYAAEIYRRRSLR